jgi:toxin ParE1/3/4
MPIILKKPLAEADLLDIWDFIANESFERAD